MAIERLRSVVNGTQGNETILVVEDEAAIRGLAVRVLESAGYTVLTAASGEEALALLEGHDGPVHLLLTDVMMPGMSGPELAKKASARSPETKIVYTSGYAENVVVGRGVLAGSAHFLGKPYTMLDLKSKVRQVLDS